MLFVVSAGNQHTNLDTALPRLASYSLNNLVSVANLQPDGTIAANSNYGPTSVDLAAPGTQILSTAPGGTYEMCIRDRPAGTVYRAFLEKYKALNCQMGKEQYVVPYLMSSHPGSTLKRCV